MAGAIQSGPTPWWQLPEYGGNSSVLTSPAPAGYTYDPVTRGYRSVVGSPEDLLAQRNRQQSIEDAARQLQQYNDNRNFVVANRNAVAADQLRQSLLQMLSTQPSTDYGGGSSGGGGSSVPFAYSGGSAAPTQDVAPVAPVAPVALPDNSAASAATFARAKDKVGAETAASVTALRSALAGRGMLGGGSERRGVTGILTAGQGQLGDTTTQQAVSDVNRQTDYAKMGYQGALTQQGNDITQRGQTIAAENSAADRALSAASTAYSGGIAQRGQNISAADDAANRQLTGTLAANAARNASVNTLLSRLY